ncbi:MAG TPA: cation:proton antiporter [Candidatus Altiarchaeales archaeon]|nr:cation:proton antiporter [Candidatus Altiarchaeales archaeon]
MTTIDLVLNVTALILTFNIFLCIYKAISSPESWNRIICINVIGTKTIVIISLIAFIFDSFYFVDVAIVYALFNFILTIALSKYIEFGTL